MNESEGPEVQSNSQAQKDKRCMISYVESKNIDLIETGGRKVVPRDWGMLQ